MANRKSTTKVKPEKTTAPKIQSKKLSRSTKSTPATVRKPAPTRKTPAILAKKTEVKKQITTKKQVVAPAASVTRPGMRFNKKVVWPLLGLLIFAVLAYLASRYLVIAWVDKKPITRFEYYNTLEKRYGKDIREQLIVQKLVESEAQKRHVSVTQADINNEISKIESEQGGAQQLNQALQAQGIDRSDLNDLVKLQLLRDKMFGADVNITDNDVNSYMEQNKANLPQVDPNNASATAQLKDSIRNQLKQQKISDNFNAWLQQNLNSNRVIRL